MRLLIPVFSPSTGTWGGLTRVLAIAEAAREAGHEVAFCASGYLEGALRERGFQVYSMPAATMFGLPPFLSRLLERRSQRRTLPVRPGRSVGSIWMVLLVSGMARSRYLRRLVEREINAAQIFRADRLFTDLDPGAFIVSRATGVPLASAYAHIVTHGTGGMAWKLMRRAIAPVLRSYGLPEVTPDELCFGKAVLKIIPSIPELDDTDPSRVDVRYVGYLLAPIRSDVGMELDEGPERRYVFVYVGTGSISLDALERVLPQVFPPGGELTCLVGAQSIQEPYRIGGVDFRPYVPAEAVLPRSVWTICHGGQNTIIQSLMNGVPLVIFPGPIFERRYNARKVEAAGAGLMGEVDEFNADWLRRAFARQAECASKAVVLGERIRSYGGAAAAVEAIAGWAGGH